MVGLTLFGCFCKAKLLPNRTTDKDVYISSWPCLQKSKSEAADEAADSAETEFQDLIN